MMLLQNVTLEMSLKPFFSVTDDAIEAVARQAFRQWSPLLRHAKMASILLWTADGSEILDYKGKLEDEIEWARYIGSANPKVTPHNDPELKSIHSRSYLYTEKPAKITYADLKRIVAGLKKVGQEMLGIPVRVGETFDPGCEFAKSPFKYERHNEICMADTGGPKSFACCYATLNADKTFYVGFPEGIPQDTPLGTFLGRQLQHLLTDIGFDYVWFSNGFGFGLETWMTKGPMFNGEKFSPELGPEIKEKILKFWRDFRKECPKFPVECRGTNLSTGIDLASDGVPLREIYNGDFNIKPPPNSPWAALNYDFGLELTGYMSHIAELPATTGYPFRFYTHDPWWHNSPWLDRYGREPYDIYMPMSVSRIGKDGRVENPNAILFLTIDDSHGKMPEQVPNEVIPHILEGMRNAPDQPGPLIWVYPFDEYHDLTFNASGRINEPFFADWFIRSSIRNGLPLNTVVSTRNFLATRKLGQYRRSVLVTPLPDKGTELSNAMIEFIEAGGRVIFYGPIHHADPKLRELLNIRIEAPMSGTLEVELTENIDDLTQSPYPTSMIHRDLMCAGGCHAVLREPNDSATKVLATVSSRGAKRVVALVRRIGKGAAAWVRGTNSSGYVGGDLISGSGHLPRADDPEKQFEGDLLMRFALASLGYHISTKKKGPGQPNPITCVSRHDNGFFFSGYVPDMTVEMRVKLPQGAPVFVGCDAEMIDGRACYRMPRAWRRECRVFVEQAEGVVTCHEKTAEMIGLTRRLRVTGLKNATVRVYPENNDKKVTLVLNGSYPYFTDPPVDTKAHDDDNGRYLEAAGLTGELLIQW